MLNTDMSFLNRTDFLLTQSNVRHGINNIYYSLSRSWKGYKLKAAPGLQILISMSKPTALLCCYKGVFSKILTLLFIP